MVPAPACKYSGWLEGGGGTGVLVAFDLHGSIEGSKLWCSAAKTVFFLCEQETQSSPSDWAGGRVAVLAACCTALRQPRVNRPRRPGRRGVGQQCLEDPGRTEGSGGAWPWKAQVHGRWQEEARSRHWLACELGGNKAEGWPFPWSPAGPMELHGLRVCLCVRI